MFAFQVRAGRNVRAQQSVKVPPFPGEQQLSVGEHHAARDGNPRHNQHGVAQVQFGVVGIEQQGVGDDE